MPRFLRGMLGEFLIVAAIIGGLYCLAARGDSTVNRNRNAFGTLSYQDNPNAYLMGFVSRVDVARAGKGRTIIVLEIRPTNTYQMFSQQLQLCDGIDEELGKKLMDAVDNRSVVVFTYSKIRHLTECNDLYRVDKVEDK